MIGCNNLRHWLLKAIVLNKIRSGLVLVKRPVNRQSGTNMEYRWVRPDQVKATDHVLVGHVHLHPTHSQAPADPKQYSNYNYPYSNAIKQQTAAFFSQMPDVQTFYQALHNLGITYAEHPTKPGITLMRAKGAMNAAIHNGFNPSTFPQHLLGLKNPAISTTASQPTTPPTQSATQAQPVAPTTAPSSTSQPSNSTTSINLPPKAAKASPAAKQSASDFAKSFATKQDFYDALTQMGITWKTTNHSGINNMWAISALAQHIENGFDVATTWSAIQNGANAATTASTPTAPSVQPVVPPPVQSAPPPPPVDPDLIKIPTNATPEQKALAELINNMTDVDTINKCFILRAVPEDAIAKRYMLDVSFPKLKNWMSSITDSKLASIVKNFQNDMEEINEPFNNVLSFYKQSSPPNLMQVILKALPITGCSRSLLEENFNSKFTYINMDVFTNPQNYVATYKDAYNPVAERVPTLLKNLRLAFAGYATADQSYGTNRGYEGDDPEVYAKQYDVNKEGFVRLLQKIKQDNSTDSAVGTEVDSMIQDYDDMMSLVRGNPQLLESILDMHRWSDSADRIDDYGISGDSPVQANLTLASIRAQTNVLTNTLINKGYSIDDIAQSLQPSYWLGTRWDKYRIHNSKTNTDDVLDLSQEIDPVSGKTIDQMGATRVSNEMSLYLLTQLQQYAGLTDAEADQWYKTHSNNRSTRYSPMTKETVTAKVKKLEALASIDQTKFYQIHTLANKIFGVKMDWNHSKDTNMAAVAKETTPAKNVVLANLIMTHTFTEAASRVSVYAYKNSKNKFNDQGNDYSGNFSYFDGAHRAGTSLNSPIIRQYDSTATYTPQELDAKITEQLNLMPSYSSDYIHNLSQLSGRDFKKDPLYPKDILDINTLMDDPRKDVLYKTTVAMLSLVPQTVLKNPNLEQKIAQKLNYMPYDFSATVQPRLIQPKVKSSAANTSTGSPLKLARERLFRVATCSIATEPTHVSNKLQQEYRTTRMDYEPGETDPDGGVYTKKLHPKFALLFNSPVFAIKNSVFKKSFEQKQAELQTTCSDSKCYEPLEISHGCSRAAAANIIERDAAWYMGDKYQKTAQSLGPGKYASNKTGKNFAYVGDRSYGFNRCPGTPGAADGCIIFSTAMRGDNYTTSGSNDKKYTSSSAASNRGWYEWEICIRDNSLINPHHFVDVSCVELGSSSGMSQDNQGNYVVKSIEKDSTGNPIWNALGDLVYKTKILYDKDGKNVNVDWNYDL